MSLAKLFPARILQRIEGVNSHGKHSNIRVAIPDGGGYEYTPFLFLNPAQFVQREFALAKPLMILRSEGG